MQATHNSLKLERIEQKPTHHEITEKLFPLFKGRKALAFPIIATDHFHQIEFRKDKLFVTRNVAKNIILPIIKANRIRVLNLLSAKVTQKAIKLILKRAPDTSIKEVLCYEKLANRSSKQGETNNCLTRYEITNVPKNNNSKAKKPATCVKQPKVSKVQTVRYLKVIFTLSVMMNMEKKAILETESIENSIDTFKVEKGVVIVTKDAMEKAIVPGLKSLNCSKIDFSPGVVEEGALCALFKDIEKTKIIKITVGRKLDKEEQEVLNKVKNKLEGKRTLNVIVPTSNDAIKS